MATGRMKPTTFAAVAKPYYEGGHGKGRKCLLSIVRFTPEELHDAYTCAMFMKTLKEGKTTAKRLIVELPSSESDAKDIAKAFMGLGQMEVRYYGQN